MAGTANDGAATELALPSASDIAAYHELAVQLSPGMPQLRALHLLESAVARVETALAYGAAADAVDAAALLCCTIIKNHPFMDGNKRGGYSALAVVLWANGLRLEAGDMELFQRLFQIAETSGPWEEFAAWIRDRVEPDTTFIAPAPASPP
ncbi:MAG: type II toxin-antitoxin system death-on-curing family toxin [Alphaproteobacteria bacterium]|nr:type II toxin-antitoxin system death-on-curing family toxin [Alphaproteobacteria bacterium]